MSKRSQPGASGAQRKSQPPITQAEALELLTSAASYCARAGVEIEIIDVEMDGERRVALALPPGYTASVTDGKVAFAVREDAAAK